MSTPRSKSHFVPHEVAESHQSAQPYGPVVLARLRPLFLAMLFLLFALMIGMSVLVFLRPGSLDFILSSPDSSDHLTNSLAVAPWSSSLPAGYQILDGTLYRQAELGYEMMMQVDVATVVFLETSDPGVVYSKDRYRVYRNEKVIEGADVSTFMLYEDQQQPNHHSAHISYDNRQVYFDTDTLSGANPTTFTAKGDYFSDDDQLWYAQVELVDADAASFTPLSLGYAKDATNVYYGTTRIPGADATTIVVLGGKEYDDISAQYGVYAKDAIRVYIGTEVLAGADAGTFVHLRHHYAKDAARVYYDGQPILGADTDTFEVLGADSYNEIYARDEFAVYERDQILVGVDPATFEIVGACEVSLQTEVPDVQYIKDATSVWCGTSKLPQVRPHKFSIMGRVLVVEQNDLGPTRGYVLARDDVHVYCGPQHIEGAKPLKFSEDELQICGEDLLSE
jgi:hypothetical protein